MILKKRFVYLPVLVVFFSYLLMSTYGEVRTNTIADFNAQQMLLARQAASGIRQYFAHFRNGLVHLSRVESVIEFSEAGKDLLTSYFDNNQAEVRAITRVDASGTILYTVPYNQGAIGADISGQEHVRTIMASHRPVVSDVFQAVQGYAAIAYHVPVMQGDRYQGSLAILVPFENLSARYLTTIRTGPNSETWVVSQKGIELFSSRAGNVGGPIAESASNSTSALSMIYRMLNKEEGVSAYECFPTAGASSREPAALQAAFTPIDLGNTFWSIVVATPERQILSTLSGFSTRLFLIALMVAVGIFAVSYYLIEARAVLKQEEQRKASEKALRESQETFLTVLDGIDATVYAADMNTYEVLFMNRYMKTTFGRDAVGGVCYREFRNTDVPCGFCTNQRLLADDGTPSGVCVWEGENPVTGRWYINYDRAIRWIDGRMVRLQIATDITHIKKLEKERQDMESRLQQSRKMEAIGTLAGGVAHDLNNVLSGIVSYPDLLLMDLPEDSPLRKPIETIKASGQKAADIVQDLLTLARRGVAVRKTLDLNDMIREYTASLEHRNLLEQFPAVQVRTLLHKAPLVMEGSPVHLRKALMNLVLNAVEAMEQGGTITIRTCRRYLDAPVNGYDTVSNGDFAVLEVTDEGIGIRDEDIERIFEPFYTKKVMGRSGTGLGMAVVWGAVQDHGGYIHIKSCPGQGTVMTLYFPLSRDPLRLPLTEVSSEELMGEGQSVLVVDDQEDQRRIATGILARLGYNAAAVGSGEAALRFLESNRVDLILLDMILGPGMDGLDTFRGVMEIQPGQRCVIASGFSETDRVRRAQELGAGAYVRKPYTIEKIGAAIKAELMKQGKPM